MFRLAVLLGLLAFCAAKTPIDHCCSAEDRHIIEEQWKALWRDTESSKLKIGFGRRVLLKLVELKPDAKALFSGVDIDHPEGGAFSAHSMRILNALDMIVNLMEDQDALDEALDHLADQHAAREGVKREHFVAMGQVLNDVLPRVLDDFNSMSWKSCFKVVLTKMAGKLQA